MGWNDDYNDVPSRIIEFRTKHPDGSFQSEIVPSPFEGFIVVKAYAYRAPGDERPGTGLAWEPVPGKTNFTRDSELQNAETSAIGRAIIACGAADAKKGMASAEEIRNRTSEDAPARGRSSEASGDVRANTSRPAGPSPDSSESQGLTGASAQDSGSSGGAGDGVDGEAAQDPAPSDSLKQLFSLYSNQGQALRAANKKFGTKTMAELNDLGPAALATLIRQKEGSVAAS
jgi:hypothetical protein